MDDRRVAPRRTVYIPAKLTFSDGKESVDCLIVNNSDEGLGVELEMLDVAPKTLALAKQVSIILNNGDVISAVRRWSQGRRIGLKLMNRYVL